MPSPPQYEDLPCYTCTVYKSGYVKLKREHPNTTTDLSWSLVYMQLRGTILYIHRTNKTVHELSMHKGNCGIASDYPNNVILRLKLAQGQYLLRVNGLPEIISWFEHLQASINISGDLDKRKMPRIFTLSRATTTTLTVGKTQAVIPILLR